MKTHNCKSCGSCHALCSKVGFRFWKNGKYYCDITEALTNPENNCEHWQRKPKREYNLSPERFDQAKDDIEYIMDALEDL